MTLWHADEPPGMAVSGPGLVGTVYEGGMGVGAARSVFATVTWLHVPSVVRSCPAGRWEGRWLSFTGRYLVCFGVELAC